MNFFQNDKNLSNLLKFLFLGVLVRILLVDVKYDVSLNVIFLSSTKPPLLQNISLSAAVTYSAIDVSVFMFSKLL